MSLSPKRQATLTHSVEDLFGGAGDQSRRVLDRPAADDAGRHADLVGRSPIPNLFLNTGHGTLGWTMAAGSGRVLADTGTGAQ
jgi:D-amino-acid dehydrogenase